MAIVFRRETTMVEKPATEIRFCDEYEDLFHQCLSALTQWTQLRAFEDRRDSAGTPAENEARRAKRSYVAAFSALRRHSRACILCEERLRVHANSGLSSAASRAS
jgi:hypothetical protein